MRIQTRLSDPPLRRPLSSPLRASWATWLRQATCSAACASPTEESAELGMRLHIQQAPHRLEEGEKGRITATRICALRNINVFSMGFRRGMKRCTFRSLLRVVGESDIDRINGEGGVWGSGVGGGLSKQDTGAGLSVCGYRAKLIKFISAAHFWVVPAQTSTDQKAWRRTNSCPFNWPGRIHDWLAHHHHGHLHLLSAPRSP